ncbi:hypothetical protein [Blastococcus sp. KM273129]|uniref:hypothetical protein n=1 Tax=Blastococcus sp. KM273129 TaxID=2570315 RepID=UPI001F181DAA|nr:hypothetical protein [Blastococcus sp. KM273129]MCF6736499.1 hypothetical protein [Blastococcus sp. KM273129]
MTQHVSTPAPTTEIRMGATLSAPDHAVVTGAGAPDAAPAARGDRPRAWRLPALAGAALVSPAAMAAQYALNSAGLPRQDAEVYLTGVAADSGAMVASTLAYGLAMTTMVAVGALAAVVLRRTAPIASALSAALLTLGAVGGGAFVGLRLAALAMVEDGAVLPGGTEAFVRLQGAIIDPVGWLLICAILGTVALAVALHRSRRAVGWWPAVVTVVGFVLASGEFPNAVSVAGAVVQGAALVPLARLALGSRD